MYGKGKVILLEDESREQLGVDVREISDGSHKRVLVECLRCGERLTREYRLLTQLHNCPTRVTRDGVDLKWCSRCSTFLPLGLFSENKHRYDGLTSYCRKCLGERSKTKQKDFSTWMKRLLSQKKCTASKSGTPFDLTIDYMHQMWEKQKGRCAYTLVPMVFGSTGLDGAWIERVNPNAGYVCGNVIWSSKGINCLKNNASFEDFTTYLSNIDFRHLAPASLECKVLHPDGKIPSRKRDTDAGYDLYSIENVIVPAKGRANIRTGMAIVAPPGYYLTIEGRSGLAVRGIIPFRGIIDATYCGEMMVGLTNISDEDYAVSKHDRIAQLIGHNQVHFDFRLVDEISPEYNQRGTAGFGSSGV